MQRGPKKKAKKRKRPGPRVLPSRSVWDDERERQKMPRPTSPDSREMVRATVTVHGRVQGVYFRAFLKEQARTAGANGFVRNLTNGRVEAIFEGPRVVVDTMVGWCKHGSPASEVTRVDIDWGTPQGLSGFDIRY